VTSAGLGAVSGLVTMWSRLPSFIITLAMMNIAYGLSRYLTRSVQHDVPGLLDAVGNRGWMLTDRLMVPYSALLAAAALLAGHYVLGHTRFGRMVYMTGANRRAAYLSGVRCGRIVVAWLVISALAGGLGGLVNAGRLGSVSLDQNRDLLLQAVACVVLGGTSLFGGQGSMGRTVLGVLTFTTLDIGLNQMRIEDHARPLVLGVVLLSALVANGLLARRRGA
jgi:ribose transport system permease protein